MKRRYAVFAVIFAVSILISVQAVEVVKANPFIFYTPIEPIPGTIPPTIIIYNLQNNSINPSLVTISFYVGKPQLAGASTSITGVYYTLDNNPRVKVYSNYVEGQGNGGVPELNSTFTLSSLPSGSHSLTLMAYWVVLKSLVPQPQGFEDTGVFYLGSNSTAQFIVDSQLPIPQNPTATPTPTLPTETSSQSITYPSTTPNPTSKSTFSPSPVPTSNQNPTSTLMPTSTITESQVSSVNWLNQTFLASIAIVIIILAVGSVSLVYFRRRKGKP